MKRNVTVTLDPGTARWVRVEAARRDMSISQYLGELLAEERSRREGYDAARRRFMARAPRPLRADSSELPSRAERYRPGTGGAGAGAGRGSRK